MRVPHQLVLLLSGAALLLSAACQTPPAPPPPEPTTPPAPTTAAKPTAAPAPTVLVSPVPLGASRAQVLESANQAYAQGAVAQSIEFYERVLNSPPDPRAPAEQAEAIDRVVRFRLMLAFAALRQDDEARRQLTWLQETDPQGAMTRLATEVWHQYGLTGSLEAACVPGTQAAATASATLETLAAAGLTIPPQSLCRPPG